MRDPGEGPEGQFPPELASETIARLYESQGLPEKAAVIRALCGRPHVGVRPRDGQVEVTWQASSPIPLRLRIVTFAPGDRPRVVDLDADPSGTRVVKSAPGWTCVAIGRQENGRFVPLAHAVPVRI